MAPSKRTPDESDKDYKDKRQRNNDAVKKSREKAKHQTAQMEQKVHNLKTQNDKLESDIQNLEGNLTQLKEIFLEQANSASNPISNEQLKKFLDDSANVEVHEAVDRLVNYVHYDQRSSGNS